MKIIDIDLKEHLKTETYVKEYKVLDSLKFTVELNSTDEIGSFREFLNSFRRSESLSVERYRFSSNPFKDYDDILDSAKDKYGKGAFSIYLVLDSLSGGHLWKSYVENSGSNTQIKIQV